MTKTFFRQMTQQGILGGVLLVAAALLAMVIANSGIKSLYYGFLDMPVVLQFGAFVIEKPLLLWINDGLMAIFFFLIGLEVKREVLVGELSSPDKIALPAIGAIAGIAVPALFYLWFNGDNETALKGWAVPSATDIAFALGVFAVFASRVPLSLKLFLLSVAIFDDIGAILIIALFYSAELSTLSLQIAAVAMVILFLFNRMKVPFQAAYIIVGFIMWAAVLKSGVHATLAGFILALFIPMNVKTEDGNPMLYNMEHGVEPWVAYFILPLFAFANAGVDLSGVGLSALTDPITLGIIAGLFVGKQLGIFGCCWLAIKLGLAKLPKGANWAQFYGVCALCGIGFTMSLFIGSLAFENAAPEYFESVKLGVLVASLLSAVVGASLIHFSSKPTIEVKHGND